MNYSLTATTPARSVRADAFVAQMRSTERAALSRAIERQDVAELERAAIARRIKDARLEAGLSQPEMADALGVIPRTYQNYESVANPRTPWSLMNEIATVTGKSTEWLIHGEREPAPDLVGAFHSDGRSQLGEIKAMLAEQKVLLLENQQIMRDLAAGLMSEEPIGPPWAALARRLEEMDARDRAASPPAPPRRRTSRG